MIRNNNNKKNHWQSSFPITEDIQNNFYGFVYVITNMISNRKYIGCKKFNKHWQSYTGSNTELNKDIETFGSSRFEFKILNIYKTKSELRLAEAQEILISNALTSKKYYNQYIQLRLRINNNNKI